MSFGDGDLHVQVAQLKTENARLKQQLDKLRELPEIVRCRDCRWAKPDHSDHEYRGEYRCNMWIADVDAYGFCFRAMRKEGGE